MPIQTLKEGLHAAKAEFLSRLVAVLVERTDLSQKQINFGPHEPDFHGAECSLERE
jgi:hypothetical protein